MYDSKGRQVSESLIKKHMPMVRDIARRLRATLPSNIELDDLVQVGYIGLMDAMERFDPNSGSSLEAFAAKRVRGAILDELRSGDMLSRTVRDRSKLIESVIAKLEHKLGRPPLDSEIAEASGMSIDDYHDQLVLCGTSCLASLEELQESLGEGATAHLVDDQPSIVDQLIAHENRALLQSILEELPEREKHVLALYYQEGLSMRDIAEVLDVSAPRVHQLHTQAVRRIRARFER